MPSTLVSIVIVPDAWTGDLRRTVESAAAQTHAPVEVLVVDAGDPGPRIRSAAATFAARPSVRVVEAARGGPGALRNAGVRAAAGSLIVCLDEGDLLDEAFSAEACARLADQAAGYVVGPAVMEPGGAPFEPPVPAAWGDEAVLGVTQAAPLAVLFRKALWKAARGFDEQLEALVSYDFLLRIHEAGGRGVALEGPALRSVARRGARYRAGVEREHYLAAVQAVLARHREALEADPPAVLFGRERALREIARQHRARVDRRDRLFGELRELTHELGRLRLWLEQQGRSGFDWGDLRRTSPVSRDWGYDRGKPVDRYYIETFLEAHAADVRGLVLEVQENDFTTKYGGDRVTRSDVVDLDPANPRATVVADLRHAVTLGSDTYDCVILTQTLHVIDDMRRVLEECRRILKPGGALLVTLPCASRVCLEYGRDGDLWRVTEAGARALFAQVFPPACLNVRSYGNVFVNAAFLYGLACEEIAEQEFEVDDPYFPLLVGVRAVKPTGDAPRRAAPRHGWGDEPPRGAILLYHRIAAPPTDLHGLSVHPDHFDEQMAWVARHGAPMTLADLARAARERRLPPRAVAVTFDDGYLDNLRTARPILARHGVPATFFVPAGALDDGREFWWDTLERVFFGLHALPAELPADLARGDAPQPVRNPDERAAAHWALYYRLVRLDAAERAAGLDALVDWAGLNRASPVEARPMTTRELTELAASPSCVVGAHGVSHLALPEFDIDMQRAELTDGRRRLEAVVGTAVEALAYPYGAWNVETARLARACGFSLAVTCDERLVEPGEDPWRLPRVEVKPVLRGDLARRLHALARA